MPGSRRTVAFVGVRFELFNLSKSPLQMFPGPDDLDFHQPAQGILQYRRRQIPMPATKTAPPRSNCRCIHNNWPAPQITCPAGLALLRIMPLTNHEAKLVGRAVLCPPNMWIAKRRRARSDAPYLKYLSTAQSQLARYFSGAVAASFLISTRSCALGLRNSSTLAAGIW